MQQDQEHHQWYTWCALNRAQKLIGLDKFVLEGFVTWSLLSVFMQLHGQDHSRGTGDEGMGSPSTVIWPRIFMMWWDMPLTLLLVWTKSGGWGPCCMFRCRGAGESVNHAPLLNTRLGGGFCSSKGRLSSVGFIKFVWQMLLMLCVVRMKQWNMVFGDVDLSRCFGDWSWFQAEYLTSFSLPCFHGKVPF